MKAPATPGTARGVRAAALAALVLALAAVPLVDVPTAGLLPGSLASPGTLQLLGLCFVFGGLALSYDLLFGYTGLLSFGHALFFAVGVYACGMAMAHLGLPLALAALVALGAALACALLVGAVSLRTSGIAFAMVTLAFAQAGSILVTLDPGGLTGGELGLGLAYEQVPEPLVGVLNTGNVYWLALAVLVGCYVAATWATRSAPGRMWQGIRENELRVRVLGVRPWPYKLMVFVLAALLAAACGVVYLLLTRGADPGVTTARFTLSLLVMVVLGGAGTRWGAVLGGVLYTYLNERLTALAGSGVVEALPVVLRAPLSQPLFLLGLLFILVILFVPGGIAGLVTRGATRVRTRMTRHRTAPGDTPTAVEPETTEAGQTRAEGSMTGG